VPFLIAEVMASNIGGTATLIGDPPNIIIASRSGLTFNDFLLHLTPLVVIEILVFTLVLPWLFKGSFAVDPDRVDDVMRLNEREAIEDRTLLLKCGLVLLGVFTGFVGRSVFHVEPSVVALLGAGLLVLISGVATRDYMSSVEWQTLLFFAGLFIMVGALVKTGVIGDLAEQVREVTQGRALLAVMLILVVSAVLSGIVDNIPYVATMSPVVLELTKGIPDPAQAEALWWALAIGADFGGNATAVGASANVVVIGLALRAGSPISFWDFTRKGIVMTAITIAVAAPYLWLRYFAFA
jgi:Na+/H+ antiporter NhaD/arsenite permease-like protein